MSQAAAALTSKLATFHAPLVASVQVERPPSSRIHTLAEVPLSPATASVCKAPPAGPATLMSLRWTAPGGVPRDPHVPLPSVEPYTAGTGTPDAFSDTRANSHEPSDGSGATETFATLP